MKMASENLEGTKCGGAGRDPYRDVGQARKWWLVIGFGMLLLFFLCGVPLALVIQLGARVADNDRKAREQAIQSALGYLEHSKSLSILYTPPYPDEILRRVRGNPAVEAIYSEARASSSPKHRGCLGGAAEVLPSLANLQSLSLRNDEFTKQDAAFLARTRLKFLTLRYCRIEPGAIAALVDCRTLEKLTILTFDDAKGRALVPSTSRETARLLHVPSIRVEAIGPEVETPH